MTTTPKDADELARVISRAIDRAGLSERGWTSAAIERAMIDVPTSSPFAIKEAEYVLDALKDAGMAVVLVDATEEMIEAGTVVEDQVRRDLENYVSGVTTDWDTGMKVDAISKAMLAASPLRRKET